ncbi:LOW QUALITY PROTEIN: aspartate dehydrogenase domain-containing protein [Falco peregrinus]|uniref:LOW QUALITY PROTEIN: aspartate dehydrogenase domain-containing protein n=1 Tax=Falco peregrinus TaxID=8954 RepID=UPI002479E8F8|nr:LOW QUALITY PROTEIN: aspartate dehydrogenase domain-containing protein [Falco peregrinus]
MAQAEVPRCRRVGILGYGQLGQFLAGQLLAQGPPLGLALAFVWVRGEGRLEGLPPALRLPDLRLLPQTEVDLVVEVAHPCVAQEHGEDILAHADFMLGSPTVLADPAVEQRLRGGGRGGGHTLYVPRGALWGCEDIARMDRAGTLAALKVTMTKAPQSFRLEGWLQERLVAAGGTRTVLYEGPLRPLCPLAPNNVNTMAAAAVAAPHLGFDGIQACLVADPSVPDWHIVEVEVTSVGDKGRALSVTSIRRNPAAPGAVTGSATRHAFWSSLLACHGHGGCVQLC